MLWNVLKSSEGTERLHLNRILAEIRTTIDGLSIGGGGTWGSITGTLSTQTDLQTTLNGKVATSVTVNGRPLSSNVTITGTGFIRATAGVQDTAAFSVSESIGASWYAAVPISVSLAAPVDRPCPFSGTIVGVTVVTQGGTGSCVVNIKKDGYASFPSTTSICAAAKPTITSGIKYTDTTLTGWTTTITAGDILRFVVESSSTFTSIIIILEIRL